MSSSHLVICIYIFFMMFHYLIAHSSWVLSISTLSGTLSFHIYLLTIVLKSPGLLFSFVTMGFTFFEQLYAEYTWFSTPLGK